MKVLGGIRRLVMVVMTGLTVLVMHQMLETPPNDVYSNSIDGFEVTENFTFMSRLEGPISTTDPQLINLIRQTYLIPPSTEPYKFRLKKYARNPYLSAALIMSVVQEFFNDTKGGFFIEAGALDGEYMSHTLELEMEQGWRGLLVEPDRTNFKELLEKHRKTWHASTCLSTGDYPHKVLLKRQSDPTMGTNSLNRGTSSIIKEKDVETSEDMISNAVLTEAFCVPIRSLLMALNVTHVDFFVLDVERAELDVLKTFPFEEVSVDVWAIEHIGLGEDKEFVSFMISKGYYYFDTLCEFVSDYVFVRKKSELYKQLEVPVEHENRTEVCKYKTLVDVSGRYVKDPITADAVRDKHHYPQLKFKHIPVVYNRTIFPIIPDYRNL